MTKLKAWRQGDVGIVQVGSLPKGATEIQHDGILAYGEVSGHKHQLVGGNVKYFRDVTGELFFEVTSRFVDLNHGTMPTARIQEPDSHLPHSLPTGIYRCDLQNEWDWQALALRQTQD